MSTTPPNLNGNTREMQLATLLAKVDMSDALLRQVMDTLRLIRMEIREMNLDLFPPPVPLAPIPGVGAPWHTPFPLDPRQIPTTPPDPSWTPIYHRNQRPESTTKPCWGVALYLTQPPQENRKASLEEMRIRTPDNPQWRIPQPPLDEPRCASCNALIDPFSSTDLDYLSVMQPAGSLESRKTTRRKKTGDPTQSTADGSPGVGPVPADRPSSPVGGAGGAGGVGDIEAIYTQEFSEQNLRHLQELAKALENPEDIP